MIIKGIPDKWKLGGGNELNVLSKNWINSIASDLNKCLSTNDNRVTIDLSNINFVSAFEWAIFIAIIDRILTDNKIDYVDIDLVGNSKSSVLDPKEYLRYLYRKDYYSTTTSSDFYLSHRVYQIAGFL